MEHTKWSENVVLVDADYADAVAFNLIVNFERMLNRPIPKADLAHWLVCVALDGGVEPGENDIQVVLIHGKDKRMLDNFAPSDFDKELDGKAFRDERLGEFKLSSVRSENLADVETLCLQSLEALADEKGIKRLIVVPDMERYGARVREVLQEAGIAPFTFYREEEGEAARTALLALPGVVFASVEKSGCVLTVTVEESAEPPAPVRKQSLVAPRAGVVEELTVLRGTAEVCVGEAVSAGQTLVGGYFLQGEERHETFAIARCALLCSFQGEYAFAAESEAARESALAQALLAAGGEPVAQEISVRAEGEGAVYAVRLTVRVRLSAGL